MSGKLSKLRCPKCGSDLLVEGDAIWCSYVGPPSCDFGIHKRQSLRQFFKDHGRSLTPVWRKNPPTEPGLYWFKLRTEVEFPEGVLRFCQVIRGGDGSLILGCRNFDSDHFQRIEGLQRWWAGPLLEPMEE